MSSAAWRAAHREQLRRKAVEYRALHPGISNAARRRQAAARRQLTQFRRPRCVICNNPIDYSKGQRLDVTTCGKRYCAILRHRWFGPMKPRRRKAA